MATFFLNLIPGDSVSVIYDGNKAVDVNSLCFCRVSVELLPVSDWSSVKHCERKAKPVEVFVPRKSK